MVGNLYSLKVGQWRGGRVEDRFNVFCVNVDRGRFVVALMFNRHDLCPDRESGSA